MEATIQTNEAFKFRASIYQLNFIVITENKFKYYILILTKTEKIASINARCDPTILCSQHSK